MPLNQLKYFFCKRKIIWISAIIAILLVGAYAYIYVCLPTAETNRGTVTVIWSIIVSLSTSYLITFVFYLMIVFQQEYAEYRRRFYMKHRIKILFYRLNTYSGEFLQVIKDVRKNCKKDIDKATKYTCEKERCTYDQMKHFELVRGYSVEAEGHTCEEGLKLLCNEITSNLDKIEVYLDILTDDAVNIYMLFKEAYIFENAEDDNWLGLAIDNFLPQIEDAQKCLQLFIECKSSEAVNLK